MELDDRPGVGLGHLESFKNRASFLFKDSLKIARLALVDVSTAELMTEDATNADEWGPTTKAMADICSVVYNSEDYLRIVQVLHKRFALSTKKYWRQIHKSLILLEYLLCHGPEHLVMEFREDKKQFEELTHFVYVEYWTGIDWGAALQRRAKHVLHLLTDEAFYKEERTRAQKISKGISGFGSQSFSRRSPRREFIMDTHSDLLVEHAQEEGTLLVDEVDTKRIFKHSDADTVSSPASQSEYSSWDAFSTSSPRDSPSASGRSTFSTTSDANLYEESPTSVLSLRKSPHTLEMHSLGLKPTVGKNLHHSSHPASPKAEYSPSERNVPSVQKLPPPPPVAEYKYVTPRVQRNKQPASVKSARAIPDLIII